MRRKVEWGNWGISFWAVLGDEHLFFGQVEFPVGPQGPIDGYIGSPERRRWEAICKDWMDGRCPDGTFCYLSQRWRHRAVTEEAMKHLEVER